MKLHTQETLASMTPEKALQFLKEGNNRFVNNLKVNRDLLEQVNSYKDNQFPFAIILSCMDSRTTVEHVFDQGLGDVFVLRVAGNVINEDIIGSMEYACGVVGSKLILVLGHSKCGAIKGACDGVKMGQLTQLLQKVEPAIMTVRKAQPGLKGTDKAFIDAVTQQNVTFAMDAILRESQILNKLHDEGKIGLVGAFYDIETGEVDFMHERIPLAATA